MVTDLVTTMSMVGVTPFGQEPDISPRPDLSKHRLILTFTLGFFGQNTLRGLWPVHTSWARIGANRGFAENLVT